MIRKVVVEAKLRFPFTRQGKTRRDNVDNLSCKLNVNEEYMEVFRTKSYVEMWSKAQGELGRRRSSDKLSSSSSSLSLHTHLTECLLEPRQETLIDMMKSLNFHRLLIDYFEAGQEACSICELLLRSIHQARANYQKIKRVIKISQKLSSYNEEYPDELCNAIFGELAGFSLLKNPLSIIGPVQFRDARDSNVVLLHRLTSKQKKIKRRADFNNLCKKVGGYGLVISHGALVIAFLVIAFHSMVGVVAAPGLVGCSLRLLKKIKGRVKTSVLEGLSTQLDLAAKGIFILINDFDTMSRLVRRLHDEIEHRKAVADICVRNGKNEVLKEVVKEFYTHESRFLEQLEELEDHIYLCFHTINRSRRLVLQETGFC